jgi:hypothetical protein
VAATARDVGALTDLVSRLATWREWQSVSEAAQR